MNSRQIENKLRRGTVGELVNGFEHLIQKVRLGQQVCPSSRQLQVSGPFDSKGLPWPREAKVEANLPQLVLPYTIMIQPFKVLFS